MNYYVVLGVPQTAEADMIRTAFRALVRRYHPDAGAGSSTARFREIVEAYETLGSPERRRRYDASLRTSTIRRIVEPLAPGTSEPLFSPRRQHFSWVVDIGAGERVLFDDWCRLLEALFLDF